MVNKFKTNIILPVSDLQLVASCYSDLEVLSILSLFRLPDRMNKFLGLLQFITAESDRLHARPALVSLSNVPNRGQQSTSYGGAD